jgi:ribosomal protein S27AE
VAREDAALLRDILGTLGRIEGLLRAANRDAGVDDEPSCPKCGSADLMDTSTMGNDRMTCRKCGVSMSPQEVVNG